MKKTRLIKSIITISVISCLILLLVACTTDGSAAALQENSHINKDDFPVTLNQYLPNGMSDVAQEPDFPNFEQAPTISYTIPNDEYFNNQWALEKISLLDFWTVTTGTADILVAVLDTGIDENHEDLRGKVVATANFADSPNVNDIHGHGTHIAGIIAAISNNGIGISGIAPESLLMSGKIADLVIYYNYLCFNGPDDAKDGRLYRMF